MTKISVLMPVYNTKQEWLREAIESILNQTYTDFEFIILNDGSTDKSIENVIKSYQDNRIKYFYKENSGIADTLNFGLSQANGEYIARMDSDDISVSTRFEKQIAFLDKHPEISVLGGSFEKFPNIEVVRHPQNLYYFDFIQGCYLAHPTVMFRKKDFEKYNLRYNPEYKCEDYELWSRAIRYLNIANLNDILLHYRWHETNLSKPTEKFLSSVKQVQQNMLDFLTDNKYLQQTIKDFIGQSATKPVYYTFGERLFSLKNHNEYKYLSFLGIRMKFKRKTKYNIIKLQGGLGNQMFQYAFGLALKAKTGQKILFDKSWFDEALKLANQTKEFANGVAIREYNLNIFNIVPSFATSKQTLCCSNTITEKKDFIFDPKLLKKRKSTYYEGYFQNEKYFKDIKDIIKTEFTFPNITEKDNFNNDWLNKIKACENPVFIHLRRGDYLNLQGWALTTEYYKKAIKYITEHIQKPTFFVFGQNCEDYIKNDFKINVPFEIIGETNSQNKEDWKDIALMMECKHAIIANSTFSWWAAWLGKANEGIVIAPTPFVNGQDEIICDNWVKINAKS